MIQLFLKNALNVDFYYLIDFYIRVDFAHKQPGADIPNCATNNTQRTAEQCHVAEIKWRLEQAIHSAKDTKHISHICRWGKHNKKQTASPHSLCLKEEIIKRIDVYVDGGGRGRQEAGPLPSIVLGIQ